MRKRHPIAARKTSTAVASKLAPGFKREFSDQLAEGISVAFRAASDDEQAHKAWDAIQKLPDDEWTRVIEFIVDAMLPVIERNIE